MERFVDRQIHSKRLKRWSSSAEEEQLQIQELKSEK